MGGEARFSRRVGHLHHRFGDRLRIAPGSPLPHSMSPEEMLKSLAIAAVGTGILVGFGRVFSERWGHIQEQIEAEVARRAGL